MTLPLDQQFWLREFNPTYAVPQEVLDLPGVVDLSWHHDVMPSFALAGCDGSGGHPEVRLWVDHPVASEREHGEPGNRFGVCDHETQETTYNGDDLAEAIRVWHATTAASLARRAQRQKENPSE